jgi:hypothetical protein
MKKTFIYTSILLLPQIIFAQSTFKDAIHGALDIIYILLQILIVLSFLAFFWGVAKFILSAGEPAALKQGKDFMFWGVIALTVLVSIIAILGFLSNTFGFSVPEGVPLLPI